MSHTSKSLIRLFSNIKPMSVKLFMQNAMTDKFDIQISLNDLNCACEVSIAIKGFIEDDIVETLYAYVDDIGNMYII